MRLSLIFLIVIAMSILSACVQPPAGYTTSLRIMDGFIVQDEDDKSIFYLQDSESASLVELKFINEDQSDIDFEEFGHVEVIGQYNNKYNFMVVDQILDTRQFIALEPLKAKD